MLVVRICYHYNFLFLSSRSSQKYNTAPEGCPVDWQDLMMILGGAVMKEEDLYYQFHVKRNNYIYPQDMLY